MTNDASAPTEELTVDWFLANADHTLLAPATTRDELHDFLAAARELGVARVCISPSMLPVDPEALGGLEVVTVAGFPSGAHSAETKAAEAALAVRNGAREVDMVVNRGAVKSGDRAGVEAEIRAVRDAIPGTVLKVILETASLSDSEIAWSCAAAEAAGADFVKTSTGFDPAGGASVEAVRIMADAVGGRLGVKASGGIRTAADARRMREAGATRFGVSATAAIVASWEEPAPAAASAPSGGHY
ncbi:deoxyribose-phosphate aldolase [Leucobacter sp. CSA2]|uniref:Deoxyribose-phosphate aldolase n=1 Tax=Leucobacter edaphi TaxID=2796472 RepID=A0A934QD70_9MICO|nr:deoxyribose-phosphate aldolase [Leucobacter edaphi]MBK0422459.1 deoxyribose-phosphate aldolase [Leucobacter edaphi]